MLFSPDRLILQTVGELRYATEACLLGSTASLSKHREYELMMARLVFHPSLWRRSMPDKQTFTSIFPKHNEFSPSYVIDCMQQVVQARAEGRILDPYPLETSRTSASQRSLVSRNEDAAAAIKPMLASLAI